MWYSRKNLQSYVCLIFCPKYSPGEFIPVSRNPFRLPARYFQLLLGIRSRFNLRTKDARLVVNLSRANKQESRLVQRNKDKAAGEDLTKYDKKISVTSL